MKHCEWCTNLVWRNKLCYPHYLASVHYQTWNIKAGVAATELDLKLREKLEDEN